MTGQILGLLKSFFDAFNQAASFLFVDMCYLNSLQIPSAVNMPQHQATRPDGECFLTSGDSSAPAPHTRPERLRPSEPPLRGPRCRGRRQSPLDATCWCRGNRALLLWRAKPGHREGQKKQKRNLALEKIQPLAIGWGEWSDCGRKEPACFLAPVLTPPSTTEVATQASKIFAVAKPSSGGLLNCCC